jgi:hypothetical protein
MRRIIIPLLLIATHCHAQVKEPNHLEPVEPFDDTGYSQLVFETLVGKTEPTTAYVIWTSADPAEKKPDIDPPLQPPISARPVLWMICKPSFSPESAVILYDEVQGPADGSFADPSAKHRWLLVTVTATQPIWHWEEHPANYTGPVKLDLRRDVKLDRKIAEIEEASAKALEEAWAAVTRQTRYPEKADGGLDGVTYQFYAGGCYGETWSPEQGLPAAIVHSAEELAKIVKSAPPERPKLWPTALATLSKIKAQAAEAKQQDTQPSK